MATPNLWFSGDAYEGFMGRWSRPLGRDFVTWLGVPPQSSWLDVGCGTGALTAAILDGAEPSRVVGIDPSADFIAYALTASDARASFEVGDAQSIRGDLKDFDAVVSGLVLNFIPDKQEALRQMVGAVRPGGTVAACVWDYADGMQLLRRFWDVASDVDSEAKRFDEGRGDSICNPNALSELFATLLRNIESAPLIVSTVFRDFDDYWTPFLGGVGTAPGYVATLDNEKRGRLKETLRARLSSATNGRIELTARAWAVKGLRPSA